MTQKYRRTPGTVLNAGTREVLVDAPACTARVASGWCTQRHRPTPITFDADGLLTLDPSCSTAKNSEHPKGWCHFWLRDGEIEMVSGAQCPGSG